MKRKIPKKAELFVSHSSQDRAFAAGLVKLLRDRGMKVWYSETNILGAQQWHDEIGEALARCNWFVLILSPSSVKSKWVKRELLFALRQPRYQDRIVPVLYRKCDPAKLSWTIPDFQIVDFTKKPKAGYGELLRVWGLPPGD